MSFSTYAQNVLLWYTWKRTATNGTGWVPWPGALLPTNHSRPSLWTRGQSEGRMENGPISVEVGWGGGGGGSVDMKFILIQLLRWRADSEGNDGRGWADNRIYAQAWIKTYYRCSILQLNNFSKSEVSQICWRIRGRKEIMYIQSNPERHCHRAPSTVPTCKRINIFKYRIE
jgi:hypothetical protein